MASPSQLPELFLSHSGEQKGFVWSLYRELLHVSHSPFFDQDSRPDSLPKGSPFTSRILDACRACKLGIVVLSHEYIESMWPMLELQQLLFHNPSSPHNVFPIFYELKPVDLCRPENLARWKSVWDRRAPVWLERNRDQLMATPITFQSLTLDTDSWPRALEMLRYQNGQIRPENKDDHTFIQTIVSNICKMHPPPESFRMDDHFKGAKHIQQEIDQLFQQQQQRDLGIDDACKRPNFMGLYGVGGSGKTTVCKHMLNFYNKEYPGSCCFIQFPSKQEDESQWLLQSMKDILSKHGYMAKEVLETIKSVEEVMPRVQQFLRQYKVFFVLDNVWDWAFRVAKQIVKMDYMLGSKLLVTSRSKNLLQDLSSSGGLGEPLPMHIVHVPSISEEEATDVLKAYSCTILQYIGNGDDLRDLARSCFFEEQCHPLLLNAVGAQLRHQGGHICSTKDWTQLCSRLKSHAIHGGGETEDTVVKVLETSYNALRNTLQHTFLKLGTCVPKSRHYKSLSKSSKWLSMISSAGNSQLCAGNSQTTDDIRDQLIELEYHGLLQIYREDIVIHDLQMMLIQNIVRRKNNGEPGCFFFEGDVATLSASEWSRLKYIYGYAEEVSSGLRVFRPRTNCLDLDQRVTSPNVPGIEVLYLREKSDDPKRSLWLSVKDMQSLRHLALIGVEMKLEVGGWHGAPNLVSVELEDCPQIQRIESMTCLQRLQRFNMTNCRAMQKGTMLLGNFWPISHKYLGFAPKLQELSVSHISVDMRALSASSSLQELRVKNDSKLHKLSVSNWINLRKLELRGCGRLQTIEGSVSGFSTALEELSLRGCRSLESIPGLNPVGNLKRLEVVGCEALKEAVDKWAASSSLQTLRVQNNSKLHKLSVSNCIDLRTLRLWECERLQTIEGSVRALEKLSLGNCRSLEGIPDLKQAGNLRRVLVVGCEALDMGTLFNAFSSLQELIVVHISTFHKLSVSNLRRLTLSHCERLRTIEGISTALEELVLKDCRGLESIPDLKLAGNLRSLVIEGCEALKEVRVGDAALTSLEELSLHEYGHCHLVSASSCSPLPIAAFTNLRWLSRAWDGAESEVVVDVGSINLPVTLKHLELWGRTDRGAAKAKDLQIQKLSNLVNLQSLRILGWLSLTRVTGLGALTQLEFLQIWDCESLREVGHWEAPFHTHKLVRVDICSCPRLQTLSTMRHLPSLTRFNISKSPNVQRIMLPQGAHGTSYDHSFVTFGAFSVNFNIAA